MCLIAIAPKGKNKYSDLFLEGIITSAKTNKDGLGYAYRKTKGAVVDGKKRVYYSKGYLDPEKCIESLRKANLKDEDELIVHLRNSSSGSKGPENCHPFILTPNTEFINDAGPSFTINPVLFHNGHFTDFKDTANKKSDTHLFVENFLRYDDIYNMFKNDIETFKETFSSMLLKNKLAVLDPNQKDIFIIGDFLNVEGYLFSNETYKTSTVVNRGGVEQRSNFPINTRSHHNTSGFDFSGFRNSDEISQSPENLVQVEETNWDKVILVANKTNDNFIKGDKWVIDNWDIDNINNYVRIHHIKNAANIEWVTTDEILQFFDAYKKVSMMEVFNDYCSLKRWMGSLPSKTALKKVNKVYDANCQHADNKIITINYNNSVRGFRIAAIKMYVNEMNEAVSRELFTNIPKNPFINGNNPDDFVQELRELNFPQPEETENQRKQREAAEEMEKEGANILLNSIKEEEERQRKQLIIDYTAQKKRLEEFNDAHCEESPFKEVYD